MTKNSLFILVVVLVVGFAIWFSRFGKELKKTQDIVTEQQADTRKILRRQKAAIAESSPSPNEALRTRLQEELNAISQQLIQENQKLESMKQQKESITKQFSPQVDLNYTSQIQNAQFQIQSLNEGLQSIRWNDSDMTREATQRQREQDSNLRLYMAQMDQNIR
ncbi:MAG: hypothetical protein J7501_09485, partial [Bdellovibrio sp.]|nr:hypothetical protein [Bdellovibrio sp.]